MVNIVNRDGIVVISSHEDDIGYDMHDNEYTAEFLRLPDGSGFIEVGVTNRKYYNDLREQASISVTNRRIGEKGYVLVASEKQRILNSYQNLYVGKSLSAAGIHVDPNEDYYYVDDMCTVFGVLSYVNINQVGGAYIIGVYPVSEATADISTIMKSTIVMESVSFAILFCALIFLLRKLIVKNMVKVNDSLA